jgi:hypothetical protein
MFKRYILLSAAVLLLMGMLVGCGKTETGAVLVGDVAEINGSTAIVTVSSADPKESFVSSVQISVDEDLQLAVGDDVIITFSGKSTKDLPAQLIGVTEVQKITE